MSFMKLSDYLDAHQIRQTEFAAQIGRSVASVSRLVNGLQKPDLDTLLAIQAATDGEVMAVDFAPECAE